MVRHPTNIVPKKVKVGTPTTSAITTAGTTITFNHTVESDSNMVVLVSILLLSVINNITGVTYNGVPMNLEKSQASTNFQVEIWSLAAPTLGTNSVVVTTNNTMNTSGQGVAVAVAMSNVNSAVTDAGASTTTGTSTSTLAPITPANTHAMIFDLVGLDSNQAITFGEGQISLAEVQVTGLDTGTISLAYIDHGPTTTVRNYTASWAGSDDLVQILLAIRRG